MAHLKYLVPLPKNTGEVIGNFKHILIPELNLGQLAHVIRKEFLREVIKLPKMKGLPFKSGEIQSKIIDVLGGGNGK
jgi:2-oxoglutarate ferredoxin oxidoreductase subunit alpha